ncbi:ExbD/TolR family protein [Alterisphingorhabdus coralli]|uniref:Biopolymer transporter ExbD n=1 Tax=Alterisphingorhabdus coralli TaxID=3071408 RepID=A0AA97I2H2_9SPHN|nr:biopolymer transporter ExbD [Parasphingorhabdus sp. SCSIO 66989]WOE75755.1 biopolymer transporter ExbD [Parasphingorhabdus sp. SCSIO 66989]
MGAQLGGGQSNGRRRGRGGRAPMSEINVTPFVDVMLVLLIIFMITAPLLVAGVPIELPESRANPIEQEREPVQISLTSDNAIYINDDEVSPGDLPAALQAIRADGGEEAPQITLRADRALDYGSVALVLGELNRAGLNTISLVTQAGGETSGPSRPAADIDTIDPDLVTGGSSGDAR